VKICHITTAPKLTKVVLGGNRIRNLGEPRIEIQDPFRNLRTTHEKLALYISTIFKGKQI
jgi:hypothetical protein